MASEAMNFENLYGFDCIKPDKRRNYDHKKKSHEISKLWQTSHEIVNLSVRGFKNKEIAEILNIHPQTVSNTLNSELGQRKVADLRSARDDEVKKDQEKIRVLKNKAMAIYNEILDANDDQCSLMDKKKVADTIMTEFSGMREPIKVQSSHMVLTSEDIASLKERAIAAGAVVDSRTLPPKSEAPVIEAEAEEIEE